MGEKWDFRPFQRGVKKMEKMKYNSLGESYKYQVLQQKMQFHANVFNHSNKLFLFRNQNKFKKLCYLLFTWFPLSKLKQLATIRVHLDISINPLEQTYYILGYGRLHLLFSKQILWKPSHVPKDVHSLDLSSCVTNTGHKN